MTKIELFKKAITMVNTSNGNLAEVNEVVEGLEHEIELLQRKAATPRKPTKTQLENEELKNAVYDYLDNEDAPRTIKDIMTDVEVVSDLSNQRVTHLLTALRNEGKIKRSIIKKVSYYEIGTEKEEG